MVAETCPFYCYDYFSSAALLSVGSEDNRNDLQHIEGIIMSSQATAVEARNGRLARLMYHQFSSALGLAIHLI
jgi:hypothetical protein